MSDFAETVSCPVCAAPDVTVSPVVDVDWDGVEVATLELGKVASYPLPVARGWTTACGHFVDGDAWLLVVAPGPPRFEPVR